MNHRLTLGIISVAALLAACGADGTDAPSADDHVGIAVVSGGDAEHAEHASDDHDEAVMDDSESTAAESDEATEHEADDHEAEEATEHESDEATGHAADEGAEHEAEEATEHESDEHEAEDGAEHESEEATDHESEEHEADEHETDENEAEEASDFDGLVVEVEMVEFGFVADTTQLPVGEPVLFRFVNTGVVAHEAMFGSAHQQEEFAESADHGDHGDAGHHGDIAAITLDAGETGEMVLQFAEPGEVWIGCHLPGHWTAGMSATFVVA